MSETFPILQTYVKPELLKKHLKWVLMLIALGGILLAASALFFTKKELAFMGPIITLVWLILSIFSTRPYIKLKKLQFSPDELMVRKTSIIYKGKMIAINRIRKISFIDKPEDYGLKFEMASGATLFLPYFTKESYEELKKLLSND